MNIGIIQTRGMGDIVIAAPIALYYINKGANVYWPIDSDFLESFEYAFPQINFIPVYKSETGANTVEFFLNKPLELLKQKECSSIICLYSHLSGIDLGHQEIATSVSFDAYKYAIAGVPFSEKWNLKIKRNPTREGELFRLLNLKPSDDYIVIHEEGSVHGINMLPYIKERFQVVKIRPLTTNFLDWLGVIENAKSAYVVNSVYSNLIDQLDFEIEKNLYCHTDSQWTPVFRNFWKYIKN